MPRRSDLPFRDPMIRLLAEIGRMAKAQARGAIDSQTLKDALTIDLFPIEQQAVVGVPHYWAIYYHDGRGPINAKPGKFLVYFKDPANDPRIARGYPERAADIIRLTKAQFYNSLRAGELIVTKHVGPSTPHPFFTRGMDGFQDKVHPAARRFMSSVLADFIGPVEKDSTKIRLK